MERKAGLSQETWQEPHLPVWAAAGWRNGSSREEPTMPLRFRVWESEPKAVPIIEMGKSGGKAG